MSSHRIGLAVHASGSVRANAHRADSVHAVLPVSVGSDGLVPALCGRQVQVHGSALFDADLRTPGGVCPVCAAEHRRSRGTA